MYVIARTIAITASTNPAAPSRANQSRRRSSDANPSRDDAKTRTPTIAGDHSCQVLRSGRRGRDVVMMRTIVVVRSRRVPNDHRLSRRRSTPSDRACTEHWRESGSPDSRQRVTALRRLLLALLVRGLRGAGVRLRVLRRHVLASDRASRRTAAALAGLGHDSALLPAANERTVRPLRHRYGPAMGAHVVLRHAAYHYM